MNIRCKKILSLFPGYTFVRNIRRRVLFWDWTDEDQGLYDFYRQFVTPGDCIYDIGANLGNRTKVFLKLGLRVVAVEPQTWCADYLESVLGHRTSFNLVRGALGRSKGQAEMMISDVHVLSSISTEWVTAVQKSRRFGDFQWQRREMVSVYTFDSLIEEYGVPAFAKIDVEGYEHEVLAGLSQPIKGLSFEFIPEHLESTLSCITHVCTLGEYGFQISKGESMAFELDDWVKAEDVVQILKAMPGHVFGDVYCKLNTGANNVNHDNHGH